MEITSELASAIVERLIPLVPYNINLMNEKGVIVASGDKARLQQPHDGAIEVLRTGREVVISKDSTQLNAIQPGVNLPIRFNGRIIGAVGITGDPQEIYQFTSLIQMTVEVLLEQLHIKTKLHYQQQQLNAWMYELVYHEPLIPEKLQQTAIRLGIDTNIARHIYLVQLNPMNKQLHMNESIFTIQKNLPWSNTLSAELRSDLWLFAIPSANSFTSQISLFENILKRTGFSAQIGVGKALANIDGYRQSAKQAEQSLRLQQQLNVTNPKYIEDWGVTRLIEAIPQEIRNDFLFSYKQAWADLNTEYLETLRTFLNSHLQIKETSEKLHIHRNTLLYRLNRITEAFGCNPRNLNGAVTLQILLICKQLYDCANQ